MMDEHEKLCRSVWEIYQRASGDLCGEVRDYHLPRIQAVYLCAAKLFPVIMQRVMLEDIDG